jgi:pyruvate formate lyase activating enzyme
MTPDSRMNGIVFRVERFAIHDGPGIRTTVFLKGCPLRCAWCHSPESQSPMPELMPLRERCVACGGCVAACPEHAIGGAGLPPRADACRLCGTCVDVCPTGARQIAGRQMSVDEVVGLVERDRVFHDQSGGGLTISGGEPLMQAPFVESLVNECHERRIHVAVDTCGYGEPAALDLIRPDLFLFDVKAVDEERHRAITGVSNRLIFENLRRLAARQAADGRRQELIVRFPMVPGLNADAENVDAIGRLVSSLGLRRIDVLPYHRAGIAKYERLGRPYALASTDPPTADEIARVVERLSGYGLVVDGSGHSRLPEPGSPIPNPKSREEPPGGSR